MSFELATAGRVLFGSGTRRELASAVAATGARRVLLVTGRDASRAGPAVRALADSRIDVVTLAVPSEPSIDLVREGIRRAREAGAEAVVAWGGGSALDAGKALAALVGQADGSASDAEPDPMDYLEVVGRGRVLAKPPLPFVAVPTTAGTGSEVTRNAVITVPDRQVKVSLRSPSMLPRLAIVDPELLGPAPPSVIASSGLDALSQLIEPFLSVRANPLTDALAREGIRRSARALERAFASGLAGDDPATVGAREDLALASLCGGLCLANAGLGAVHGFAAPVGGMFPAPHGAACAALLAPVLLVNLHALRARAAAHPALPRLDELGALLTGARPGDVTADDAIAFVTKLVAALRIPGLARYGMTAADVAPLVERAKVASSMKGNPLPLEDRELAEIAERAMG